MSTAEILTQMGFGKPDRIEVFKSAEDDKDYNAWKVEIDHTVYVLKKTGDQESSIPRTLCHDDLLPFNVLIAKGKAAIIDWEYAGILPYPTSLARLIAHGEEDGKAFFHMKQADKDYAIEYFFEHLLKDKGINYDDYLRTMDYFLLFEYCEWIMLGNKYNDTKSERFKAYLIKAKDLAKKL